MKHQQVKVDYWEMVRSSYYVHFLRKSRQKLSPKVKTSSTYLCLVISGWVLFKLVHAIFVFPDYLKRNQVEYEKVYAKMEEKCKTLEQGEEETKQDVEPKKVK